MAGLANIRSTTEAALSARGDRAGLREYKRISKLSAAERRDDRIMADLMSDMMRTQQRQDRKDERRRKKDQEDMEFFLSIGALDADPPPKEESRQGEVYTEQEEKDKNIFKTLITPEEAEVDRFLRQEQLADAPDEPYEDQYGSIPYQIRKLKENFGGSLSYKTYDGVIYYFDPDTERLFDVEEYEEMGTWDGDKSPANWDDEEAEARHRANVKKYKSGIAPLSEPYLPWRN